LRRGFNRDSLPAGTEISVQGFQAKDGSQRANGRDITFADGTRLFVGSSGTGAPGERAQ
jgi:autotransporter translocation and assembly factor TamB